MDEFLIWINKNKEWVFSGAGIALITWIGSMIFKGMQTSPSQKIRSGDNSKIIQAGRDIKINKGSKSDDVE